MFILIDFENVYRIFPRQIENDIVARLIGNKIIYNNNEYLLNDITTKGRKSLDWDLFYAELIRYIIQDYNGSLPNKQYVLIDKMQDWCRINLKGGSYGSLQTRISKIYDTLKNQK